ncbi:hydrophobin [Moniliophthora roreri MCA 2997]|uniref:Hydrophobin n=2 Tax=Moniliophthora roreri TaxID=221103 RepID=V2XRD9_MONRO|nr:hydrophobin [Moniliophthora roreri MCA 2997]
MFSRIYTHSLFTLVAFAVLAAATPVAQTGVVARDSIPASQCSTQSLQCCNALERADDTAVGVLLGLLGVVLQNVEALVGITCSPINILGIGQGGKCAAQPVCCQNNTFNGIIAIGCVPINISL